ncbi:MAG TPA: GTP 3',8-cyclase MoaA [Aquifex aeolicus]|uniref:GTP 3',8-cyclase n=1 Tax=Aquifex aeolicus TaxID=63363 RepID=A0A7C5PYS4_AQUAO|nr:GTP 3',8-cyclase MoaA [Aquifex aeolicus]
MVRDRLGRELRELRVSVTDRCNFRCFFCMPPDREIPFLSREDLLSYEEIRDLVKILRNAGVRKVRITGGEPLMRLHLENLIAQLSPLVEDLALTTNGYLLPEKAEHLRRAGLGRITISLTTLKAERLRAIAGRDVSLGTVIAGIEAAHEAGFSPVKINTVVVRGVNDDEILNIAEFCRERNLVLRFIEYMDAGTLNNWSMEKVVSAEEILSTLRRRYDLEELGRTSGSETALRFRYRDTGQEVGVIASVTKPFCRGCSRLRLSADGKLFPCLFSDRGIDVRSLLRGNMDGKDILRIIEGFWKQREDRYSELRRDLMGVRGSRVEMFRVGG